MTYKPRSERKRASGGKASDTEPLPKEHWNQYNAKGSPEEKEEDAKPDGFKRGGHMKKRKDGGHVEGEKAKHHLGRRARGGAADEDPRKGTESPTREDTMNDERKRGGHVEERARGGRAMMKGATPFSAAHSTKPPSEDKETGPGEQAPMIP